MQTVVFQNDAEVARAAAQWLAAQARDAVSARGVFLLAVSGGKTPWAMLAALAEQPNVPWEGVHIFQVDERVAPEGHADRNLTHLHASLLDRSPMRRNQIHPMPVNDSDLDAAASHYAAEISKFAGSPARLDVVHLGLGADGHTASLVPGDAALEIQDRDVAMTGEYQGRRRMTLTYPLLNRARNVLWLATGASKREMLERLLAQDPTIPAGKIEQEDALLMTDQDLSVR